MKLILYDDKGEPAMIWPDVERALMHGCDFTDELRKHLALRTLLATLKHGKQLPLATLAPGSEREH